VLAQNVTTKLACDCKHDDMPSLVAISAAAGSCIATERARPVSPFCIRQHTSSNVSICQHTSSYVSIRQQRIHTCATQALADRARYSPTVSVSARSLQGNLHTSACVSIRKHASACVSIRQQGIPARSCFMSVNLSDSIRQHASAPAECVLFKKSECVLFKNALRSLYECELGNQELPQARSRWF
jgi:hypothetical protein